MRRPIKVFLCYAHEDEHLRKEVEKQLLLLKQQNILNIWCDYNISAGREWKDEIHQQLNTADLILLLISPDFMVSDYCYRVEMQRALERHRNKEARVVPIILRPVHWENAPFSHLEILPTGAKPITKWANADDAYEDIAKRLDIVLKELQALPETAGEELQRDRIFDLKKELRSLPVSIIDFENCIPASGEDIENYYKGMQLDWKIILAQADVMHDQQQELVDQYSELIYKTRMLCLSGEPGAGKSTLARRLAYAITQTSKQLLIEIDNSRSSDIWYQLKKILADYQEPLVIFVSLLPLSPRHAVVKYQTICVCHS